MGLVPAGRLRFTALALVLMSLPGPAEPAMPVGGVSVPRVAELRKMLHAFASDGMAITLKELSATTGGGVAGALGKAVECLGGEGEGELGERAEAVRAECWEKLSVGGGWPSVGWREAYVTSLMMLAVHKLMDRCASGAGDVRGLKDAMQHLDMALIMGGPAACEAVQQIVDVAEPPLKALLAAERGAQGQEEPALPDESYKVVDQAPATAPAVDEARAIRRAGKIPFAEFKKEFFKTDTPVVLTGVIDGWPGLQKWKDLRYIRNEFGHRTVPLEVGRLEGGRKKEGWREESMLMQELVDKYLVPSNVRCRDGKDSTGEEVAYLAQHGLFDQLPLLQGDLEVPEYCECGGLEGVNAWLGTAGTVTPLHCDTYDNFLTQAVGFKYVRLYDRKQTPCLYVAKAKGAALNDVTAQGNLSPVECEAPDYDKYPLFRDAEYTEAVLAPGDMLYIPSKHWHYVRSLTPSFSVNFWF